VHPDIRKLLEVQKVDMEFARVQRDLDSIPAEEARRRKQLERARAACEAAKHDLAHAQVRGHESEVGIRAADEEIKKLESRLNTVKNNAEYQATLFQIESVRKERGELEEEGLQLLEAVEGLRETALKTQEELQEEEATFVEFQSKASELLEQRTADRGRIAQGRDALLEGIPTDLLEKYRSLFDVRDGMAVCAVEGGHCMGCYSSITPNDMARLMGKTSIVQCGLCQRLLYAVHS